MKRTGTTSILFIERFQGQLIPKPQTKHPRQSIGKNPYFILKPGYQLILEGAEEDEEEIIGVREEITVLSGTKWIKIGRRWIRTRVVEERALEWDDEEGEWVAIEISLNWFAICNRTNDVFYFGEWSRDCEDGFDENDVCEGEESTEGSWEAGKPPMDDPTGIIARPGIIMPGTYLLGSKYFQEIAPPNAVDRAEHVAMGLEVDVPAGNWSNCVKIIDTNPAEGQCGLDSEETPDSKIYCPGVGVVRDQDLELVCYGFDCDDDDGDDDDDDDDNAPVSKSWILPQRSRLWNF